MIYKLDRYNVSTNVKHQIWKCARTDVARQAAFLRAHKGKHETFGGRLRKWSQRAVGVGFKVFPSPTSVWWYNWKSEQKNPPLSSERWCVPDSLFVYEALVWVFFFLFTIEIFEMIQQKHEAETMQSRHLSNQENRNFWARSAAFSPADTDEMRSVWSPPLASSVFSATQV